MSAPNRSSQIIQSARAASLGTLSDDGNPFVTLVTVAATTPTAIVMLLSSLARHTKNLEQRPGCSLLLVEALLAGPLPVGPLPAGPGGGEAGDPLTGARLTLSGTAKRLDRGEDAEARRTFLERHPAASMYADFGDFAFFQFDVRQAHLVAGFGRIETIPASSL